MNKTRYTAILAGVLLLAGFAYIGLNYGELARFVQLIAHIDPLWIAVAVLLQAGTYGSLAWIWYRILAVQAVRAPFLQLIPLAVAKLFADQALPSGGISGMAFVIAAFKRRQISGSLGMGVMLLTLLSFYISFAIVAVVALLELWAHHEAHRWMAWVAGIFLLMSLIVPGVILLLKRGGHQRHLPGRLLRFPLVARFFGMLEEVPDDLWRKPWLMAELTVYQTAVFLLDAATLLAMLYALGDTVPFVLVFASFVMASVVATVSLIPMGLGSFELTCTGLLVSGGVSVESAVTATLLLRGFTLWIPMIPGLLITRRVAK
ncbi:conserved hypothetical protein [Chlorobaculum parvum NCIB 8327]|uniref:Flippase-like domain-containing protein n=1 Tax=Chlorobaculum parvum (strain DSM 263 / NCIMB 8327) TaxID=517417 RepID=B3QPD4_CHLP8|nr:lysylphosphatidylglycerol synthase transmembrane domain-containing protein [Chlorobaculum parvum]ACF11787.1 conserved hypothetical protein [Chlorobaculum parvum NCIB 8327]